VDHQDIVEEGMRPEDRFSKRDCLKDSKRERRMPGEPRLHEVCPLLEGRTVKASSIAKRRARKQSMPVKHRLMEQRRASYRSGATRRTIAVNLPWGWSIAKFCFAEIDV
jgi:hypothetical protein